MQGTIKVTACVTGSCASLGTGYYLMSDLGKSEEILPVVYKSKSTYYKTVGDMLYENGRELLRKNEFRSYIYESYLKVYGDNGVLSIPGITLDDKRRIDSDDVKRWSDWCSMIVHERDISYYAMADKWCTRRTTMESAIRNNRKQFNDFKASDYAELSQKIPKEEQEWLDNYSNKWLRSYGNTYKPYIWCWVVSKFVYEDEVNNPDRELILKYCRS